MTSSTACSCDHPIATPAHDAEISPAPASSPSTPKSASSLPSSVPTTDTAIPAFNDPTTASPPSVALDGAQTSETITTTTTTTTTLSTAACTTPEAPAPVHLDLTDVPPDLLPLLFTRLSPGHRLDLRAVSRSWAEWVDRTLATNTHLNLVLDEPELQRAVRKLQRQRQQQSSGAGDGGTDRGLLSAKFSSAGSVRLWVGCRPSAALAGRNGGGAAAAAAAAAAATACGGAAIGRRVPLYDVAAHALSAVSASVASSVRQVQDQLGDLSQQMLELCIRAICVPRRHPPWRLPPRRRSQPGQAAPQFRWHAHKSIDPAATGTFFRRYAPDPPDPGLQPLAKCLPLLGPSLHLTRLSIVTANDVTSEDLRLVRQSFPRLRALGLHSHRGPTLDFRPAVLRSLDALQPTAAAAAAAAAAPPPPPQPPPPLLPVEPRHDQLQQPELQPTQQPELQPQLGELDTLVLSGVLCEWPSAGEEGLQGLQGLRALVLNHTQCRMHQVLPQIQALGQLTRLELRGLSYHPPLDPWDPSLLAAKREFMEQRAAERATSTAETAAEGATVAERHFVDGRRAPGSSSSSTGAGRCRPAVSEPRSDGSEDEDAWEEHRRQGALRPDLPPPFMAPKPQPRDWEVTRRALRPDWCATMRALGRAVRGKADLRVLVCDVECPPAPLPPESTPCGLQQGQGLHPALDGAHRPGRHGWSLLLAGIYRLRNLQELRLPHMVLNTAAQVAMLAASLPGLTCLELAALSPPPPPPPTAAAADLPHDKAVERRRTSAAVVRALWRRYCPADDSGEVAVSAGGAADEADSAGGVSEVPVRVVVNRCRHCRRCEAPEAAAAMDVLRNEEIQQELRRSHEPDLDLDLDHAIDLVEALDPDAEGQREAGAEAGLACFAQLRELVLHRGSVRQLSYWLPLPPRLEQLTTQVQHHEGAWVRTSSTSMDADDLRLLHSRVLPALARVPSLELSLGRTAAAACRRSLPRATTTTASGPRAAAAAAANPPSAAAVGSGATDAAAATTAAAGTVAAGCVRPPTCPPRVESGEALVMAMLGVWLPGSLTSLDLTAVLTPGVLKDELEALALLRIAALKMPQLRQLSCHLRTGTGGPMDPDVPPPPQQQCRIASTSAANGTAAVAAVAVQGIHGPEPSPPPPPPPPPQRAPKTAVECLNAMSRLQELRVKVFAYPPPGSAHMPPPSYGSRHVSYQCVRVPLGFVRALEGPVRVVDCSSLDAWCSVDGAVHPRDALCRARADLATWGCRSTVILEAEEYAARVMGLAPDAEARWRADTSVPYTAATR